MNRRALFKSFALLGAMTSSVNGKSSWTGDLLPAFPVRDRLDQGPFDIDQDEGW